MKLWGGRFKESTNTLVNDFNSSIKIDNRLIKEDILGSLAHVKMLKKQEIISKDACEKIELGLNDILNKLENNLINIDENSEDIHSFIEGLLTYNIGPFGKMLHTGRSRNDQVTLDLKLYLKSYVPLLIKDIIDFLQVLYNKANEHIDTIMPGYTHMQKAQPITFSHHILAYCEMFKRDILRLKDFLVRLDEMPLGSGALATSTYPIDRDFVASNLGFSKITLNSLDSVSDRDYVLELLSALSIIMMHLSRFSEEIIIWCTNEFNFIELSDEYSTGSSIMPQKKNPDVAELVRGKTGRVYGDLITLLTVMKGLPLAYNKDMQEDKEALFDALDTVCLSLNTFKGMIDTMKINKDIMEYGALKGFTNATDLADYLVKKGLPFRDAHEIVGETVLYCIKKNKGLSDLSLSELKIFSNIFEKDVYKSIDLLTCINERNIIGGPARESIKIQLKYLNQFIEDNK